MINKKGLFYLIFAFDLNQGVVVSGLTLKIATHDELHNSPPYIETMNYAQEALKQLNIQVEYVSLPLARGALMANQGLLDGELVRSHLVQGEYENLIETSEPILISLYGVVHLDGKEIDRQKIRNMKGVIPSNVRGVEKFIKELELQLVGVPSMERALDMVISKRADYAILEGRVFDSLKKDSRYSSLKFNKGISVANPLYFRLNKKYQMILPKVESAFKKEKRLNHKKYPLIEDYFRY